MAQTPEGKVKVWLRKKMKEWYPDAFHYCPPGGWFGKVGLPDDMWLIRAGEFCITVTIEAKAEGKDVTAIQGKRLRDIHACRAVAAKIVGRDETKLMMIKAAIDKRLAFLERVSGDFE